MTIRSDQTFRAARRLRGTARIAYLIVLGLAGSLHAQDNGPVTRRLTTDIGRDWTWNLKQNVRDSYAGWMALAHLGAIGATWALTVSDIDAEIQKWSAKQSEGLSIGLSLPGLAGGWFAPAIVPLWMRHRSGSVKTRTGGVAVAQAVGIAVLVGNTLKAISGRREPRYDRPEEAEERSRDFDIGFWRRGIYNGWPSGHAITNMAMAASLSNYYSESTKVRTVAYGWAAYVMASASIGFQGDIHWASDVIAGGLIGWAIGRTVGKSFAKPNSSLAGERRSPRVVLGGVASGMSVGVLF